MSKAQETPLGQSIGHGKGNAYIPQRIRAQVGIEESRLGKILAQGRHRNLCGFFRTSFRHFGYTHLYFTSSCIPFLHLETGSSRRRTHNFLQIGYVRSFQLAQWDDIHHHFLQRITPAQCESTYA